jgi:hypothetical protein
MYAAAGCQDENFPASMGNDHNTAALQCKLLIVDLLRDVSAYLLAHSPYESLAEQVCNSRPTTHSINRMEVRQLLGLHMAMLTYCPSWQFSAAAMPLD